ncbi:MAG: FAD-dependent monooxygenase [Chloroflexi bacterium]|nr:FAD-dependent monooxygenase [Chloroflexota bacterium]
MTKDMLKHDVLIIGGGPSGLSTALHLTKIAPHLTSRILILEKEHYPRPKLCAGGLVADAEIILQRLGLDVSEVPHVDASSAHFDFEGRGIKISVPKSHTIRVIRRNEFDHWLAKKTREAGIEIREGVTVKNIIPDKDGVTVETEQGNFRALIVVGADGSNGITRRCVFPNFPVYTARVLEVITPNYPLRHATQGASPKSNGFEGGWDRESVAYFDFFAVPKNIAGYVWDFPTQINGEPMRCWGIYDTNLLADQNRPQLKKPLADEMARHGFILDEYELKGHPIRWFDPSNPVSMPHVLLVGDAVGADPIFGEGISMALGYGALAAQEISESIRRNDFSFGRFKRRLVRSGLGQTLFARWVITQIIYPLKWRWFQILLWWILKPVVILVAWIFVLNWGKRIRI